MVMSLFFAKRFPGKKFAQPRRAALKKCFLLSAKNLFFVSQFLSRLSHPEVCDYLLQIVSSVWQFPCTRTSRGLLAVLNFIPAGR